MGRSTTLGRVGETGWVVVEFWALAWGLGWGGLVLGVGLAGGMRAQASSWLVACSSLVSGWLVEWRSSAAG